VNIARHLYRDAIKGEFDQLVVCSNDSDMEPALSLIKSDAPHVTLGLVMPLPPPKSPQFRGVPNLNPIESSNASCHRTAHV
jgi:hypothetical protein